MESDIVDEETAAQLKEMMTTLRENVKWSFNNNILWLIDINNDLIKNTFFKKSLL